MRRLFSVLALLAVLAAAFYGGFRLAQSRATPAPAPKPAPTVTHTPSSGEGPTTPVPVLASGDTYTVVRGDTLSGIAARFQVSVAELATLNHISNPDVISAGQVLKLPKGYIHPAPLPTPVRGDSGVAPAAESPPAPLATGKVILVDSKTAVQTLWAYEDGKLAYTFPVVTGRPELPTPVGEFSVMAKYHPITFHSPWPEGSPYYYYDTTVQWALLFHDGGFYLHDNWWQAQFGPGSNVLHQTPSGSWETGSHGCVGLKSADAKLLYDWTPVGTPVIVR